MKSLTTSAVKQSRGLFGQLVSRALTLSHSVKRATLVLPLALALGVTASHTAQALPFNTDMMSTQPSHGQIVRPKAEGAVQQGISQRYNGTKEEAVNLTNPVPSTPLSITRGARIFNSNCSPCHGKYQDGKYVIGAVSQWMPGIDLSMDAIRVKPDGHFFQFIHFGGLAIMPAYASKFSIPEHWDVVNYVRSVQADRAAGKITNAQ